MKGDSIVRKYLFIEPHPDDVALSAAFFSKHLKDDGHEVKIASLCNSSVKGKYRDSRNFCRVNGFKYVDTNFVPQVFFAEHRLPLAEYKDSADPLMFVYEAYKERFPVIVKDIEGLIEDVVQKNPASFVVTTTGLLHIVHVVARVMVDTLVPASSRIYFDESPYQWRAYAKPFLNKMQGGRVITFQPHPEMIAKKLEIFEKCYPSERYMITADRHLYYRYPEVIRVPR